MSLIPHATSWLCPGGLLLPGSSPKLPDLHQLPVLLRAALFLSPPSSTSFLPLVPWIKALLKSGGFLSHRSTVAVGPHTDPKGFCSTPRSPKARTGERELATEQTRKAWKEKGKNILINAHKGTLSQGREVLCGAGVGGVASPKSLFQGLGETEALWLERFLWLPFPNSLEKLLSRFSLAKHISQDNLQSLVKTKGGGCDGMPI